MTSIVIHDGSVTAGIEAAQTFPERRAGSATRIDADNGSDPPSGGGFRRAPWHHTAAVQRAAHPSRGRNGRRADLGSCGTNGGADAGYHAPARSARSEGLRQATTVSEGPSPASVLDHAEERRAAREVG